MDEAVEQDSENWLLSYLDLITLLLAMLVVMLAISRLHGFPGESKPVELGRWPPAACPPRRRIFRVRQGRHSARMGARPRPGRRRAGHGKRGEIVAEAARR